jgi:hypothetical protein
MYFHFFLNCTHNAICLTWTGGGKQQQTGVKYIYICDRSRFSWVYVLCVPLVTLGTQDTGRRQTNCAALKRAQNNQPL